MSPPRYSGMPNSAIASGLVDLVLPFDRMPRCLDRLPRTCGHAWRAAAAEPQAAGGARRTAEPRAERSTRSCASGSATISAATRTRPSCAGWSAGCRCCRHPISTPMSSGCGSEPDEGRAAVSRPADRRHRLLPRCGGLRGPRASWSSRSCSRARGRPTRVRVWVPGCATGEEVYSLAILLREHADTLTKPPEIKIFATDINEPALQVARTGRYPGALLDAVSPERLQPLLHRGRRQLCDRPGRRDMCVFSAHSLVRDPPFSRIDLISCRNLLIYLNADKQKHVIPIFHYALRPGGFLFLGSGRERVAACRSVQPAGQEAPPLSAARPCALQRRIWPLSVRAAAAATSPRARCRPRTSSALRRHADSAGARTLRAGTCRGQPAKATLSTIRPDRRLSGSALGTAEPASALAGAQAAPARPARGLAAGHRNRQTVTQRPRPARGRPRHPAGRHHRRAAARPLRTSRLFLVLFKDVGAPLRARRRRQRAAPRGRRS